MKRREKIRKNRTYVRFCFFALFFLIGLQQGGGCGELLAAERPNILWLSVEDISPNLGCYGDKHARTPRLDALAKQSVLYKNAFVCAPVCAPCRSSIITGVYPTTLGTHNMRCHIKLPPKIKCFPEYLRKAGYYCTNNAKTDYQFTPPKTAWDESSGKAHWKNRPKKDQPFFAVFNYTGTHESAVRGDAKYRQTEKRLAPKERHDPASLELPPYYPDTPAVREDWARYYNCITVMDKWVAERLAELDEAGLADDTIVIFWSDHGVGLPRAKRWLYDSGIHVPLIVRIPEKFRAKKQGSPGERTDELVSLIDLPPTMLNLAGLKIPKYMQGRAFLGENLTPERKYIFAARDRMDERYDMIRAVRDKRYKLIINNEPWKPYAQWLSYAERSATMKELRRLHAEGKLTPEAAKFMAKTKPTMELYDLEKDPHELKNLMGEEGLEKVLALLQQGLLQQVVFSESIGNVPESKLEATITKGKTYWESLADSKERVLRRVDLYRGAILASWADGSNKSDKGRMVRSFVSSLSSNPNDDVRYWGITIVGRLAVHDKTLRQKNTKSLIAATSDESATVRVAAAEWLCRLGETEKGLPVLVKELENKNRWVRLRAINAIDFLGEEARPAIAAIEKARDRSLAAAKKNKLNGYVARVANHTLDVLKEKNHKKPPKPNQSQGLP